MSLRDIGGWLAMVLVQLLCAALAVGFVWALYGSLWCCNGR